MKRFNSFEVLNAALGEVSPLAHNVLYYICNNLTLHNTTRAEIERIKIVLRLKLWDEETGTTRQLKKRLESITDCTNELVEKGFLVKDVIYDRTTNKRKVFYAIPESFLKEKVTTDGQKLEEKRPKGGVTKKELKQLKKQNNKIEENNETNKELEHQFSTAEFYGDERDNLPF